jgi:hypothetical protein
VGRTLIPQRIEPTNVRVRKREWHEPARAKQQQTSREPRHKTKAGTPTGQPVGWQINLSLSSLPETCRYRTLDKLTPHTTTTPHPQQQNNTSRNTIITVYTWLRTGIPRVVIVVSAWFLGCKRGLGFYRPNRNTNTIPIPLPQPGYVRNNRGGERRQLPPTCWRVLSRLSWRVIFFG